MTYIDHACACDYPCQAHGGLCPTCLLCGYQLRKLVQAQDPADPEFRRHEMAFLVRQARRRTRRRLQP